LAQALIHDPQIIIMDEPVANLDPKARIEFFDLLMKLRKKGKAIFISSHVLAELDVYADSATILDGGKIIYDGDKKKLMEMFSKHQYEIIVENKRIVQQYLKKNDIPFINVDEKEEMIIDFKQEDSLKKFRKFLLVKGIDFTKFAKLEPTLDQVYNKLIVKGSVDTQQG
jgi:ABC-2 type transport system ATP-binding protein